ncbi:hypothetical protein H2200_011677 [Cladophialophora chaetospira]|uniref:Uncharacterized protein n=1 Tax=Cladophialophora chaetospira TaxID=386627 RepID=A0AA38WZS5_9EURO|nr:hypothetical protein H2200_011677 [Cladophialophora chaetospira]
MQYNAGLGKNAVKLGDSQPSTVTVIGSTSWPGITSTTAPFTQSTALATEGTTTSGSAGTVTTNDPSAIPTSSNTGTGTGTAAPASETSSLPVASSGGGSSNTGLAAGLGAGLGAAAVLIGVLIFFLIRNRRRRNAKKAAGGPGYDGPGSGDPMVQKPFYGAQPVSPYSDSQHNMAVNGSQPAYKPPELAGAGEYNRAEMPTDGDGGTFPRRATERAELAS